MKRIRPIFKCHGGKYYLRNWIISLFPKKYQEMTYIEGCGGAASVLLNKLPSKFEIYNDLDPNVSGLVKELASEKAGAFITSIKSTPYNPDKFEWAIKESESGKGQDRYLAELVRRRFSRGGLRKAFAWSNRLRGGQPGDVNAWETFKESLDVIHERLKNVKVYCEPVVDLVKQFDKEDVLWYVDPPYLPSTRTANKAYVYEMSEEDHLELSDVLNNAKGKVVLSGYQSPLYNKMYKGWRLSAKPVANHAGQNKSKQTRIECVWRNF